MLSTARALELCDSKAFLPFCRLVLFLIVFHSEQPFWFFGEIMFQRFIWYLRNCQLRNALTILLQVTRNEEKHEFLYLKVDSIGTPRKPLASILFRCIDACEALLTQSHVTDICCYSSSQVLALPYFSVYKTVFRGLPRLRTIITVCYFARSYKLLWLCPLSKSLTKRSANLFRNITRMIIIAWSLS